MPDYSKNLGQSIYNSRKRLKMTQAELAEKAGVTEQTIRKIEHGEGNPQLEVLYELIITLKIDPAEIFYPKRDALGPARKQLEIMLADCSDHEVSKLLPVIEASLKILISRSQITEK